MKCKRYMRENLELRNRSLAHDLALAKAQADDRLRDWYDEKIMREKAEAEVKRLRKDAEEMFAFINRKPIAKPGWSNEEYERYMEWREKYGREDER